ncbi:MAG: hypothetical protein P8P15_07955 [Polaribacter sp.]|nr:hypothetical protein [Polaribacter sp.]
MKVEKKNNYTVILSDEETFSQFYKSFLIGNKKFQKENLIIVISDNFTPSREEFLLFSKISEQKKESGRSFVIVSANIDIDDFPDYFNIVPTLQEAEDVIEMEAIERELGF